MEDDMNYPWLTVVYRPDDFDPTFLKQATQRMVAASTEDADRAGFRYRAIPHHELIPACGDRTQLWHHGSDLLQDRQLFQVEDFSWDPQAHRHLTAIHRTVKASDSILLNQAFGVPEHLTTDKLSIIQHARHLGLPAAPTVAVPFGRYARTALPLIEAEIGAGPYILKPREMGMGFSVLKVDTREQLAAGLDLTAQSGTAYIVQPYLPNDGDVRVFVVGGQVVTSDHRRPAPGSYQAGASQGGAGSAGPATTRMTEGSIRVADSLDAACLQVDWLLTADGPIVSEWSAGFGGHLALPAAERARWSAAYFNWARTLWKPN
jgi:ribosomal protein S6--L-glutamate ligase